MNSSDSAKMSSHTSSQNYARSLLVDIKSVFLRPNMSRDSNPNISGGCVYIWPLKIQKKSLKVTHMMSEYEHLTTTACVYDFTNNNNRWFTFFQSNWALLIPLYHSIWIWGLFFFFSGSCKRKHLSKIYIWTSKAHTPITISARPNPFH